MIRDRIKQLLEEAFLEAQRQNLLPPAALPEIAVERPQNPEHGDYASSLPLKLARPARSNPMTIAQTLVKLMPPIEDLAKVTIAAPGFINFTLQDGWVAQQVETIREAGEGFGSVDIGKGTKVQLEFVSVNPTGPLHVGHVRGAVLGSTLANVLRAAAYDVQTEYYLNDYGSQMEAFFRSIYARYTQVLGRPVEMPQDGYVGQYVTDLAKEIVSEVGDKYSNMPPEEAVHEIGRIGLGKIINMLRADLDLIRVKFDHWFSETSLYQNSQYERAMTLLRQSGYIIEKEGALWFTSTALGEDKDNVVVRSNGSPTYFASDIAYHLNKFAERGFDKVINIWGADHQGHVPRMKAAIAALGVEPDRLKIIIVQMVTLKRGEMLLRASKRTGELITLRELVEEVGADACRFFYLGRSADSQMDFDLELAKKQAPENPVYYVQYAHARIASILRLAAERQIGYSKGDVSLLTHEAELALIRKMLLLPELVEISARTLEPHHLPYYAQDLATAFHWFYQQCRVVSENEPLTAARLKLVEAAKTVLARTLHLMGMTAPEQM